MRDLPYMDGLGHLARIGYKHVELTLRPGWNTEPTLLTRANRAEIRKRISDLGLTLVDVMEGMQPASSVTAEQNLERLRAAAEMAHECAPGAPALIQSPIGGRPGTWMERREAMAEELAKWAGKLDELDVTFCIKPHSKQVMGRPEQLLWMLDRVNHPRMKGVYDYGHFMAFGLGLEETIRQVAPRAGFVHIKDTVGKAPDHRFVLPSDGGVDYARFLKTMGAVGICYGFLVLAAIGTYAPMSVWWSYPTTFLSGAAAAGAVGLINSVGNLGGFVGPYITGWMSERSGSFAGAMQYLAASLALAGLLILTLRSDRERRREVRLKADTTY